MARKRSAYQGTQYRGGRVSGRKNLKKTGTGYENQHGVTFTAAEKKALESAVNTANKKRSRMLKAEAQLPRMDAGKPTGDSVANLQRMGYESDFILAPKSKSLQRFRSKAEYENYMENLKRVNARGYIDERTRAYKENYFKALRRNFDEADAEAIIKKLDGMSLKKYREFVAQNEETLEIYYIYSSAERSVKTNQIRSALGLDPSEAASEEDYVSLKQRARRLK